jgi:hypothetical protein
VNEVGRLFQDLYRVPGTQIDLSGIRIHHAGVDSICRQWGARAMTVGSDIYFRSDSYAPHTARGLWLLAHEVAHVVQQRRGPVRAVPLGSGWAVGPRGGPEEREADAAADAVLAGRPFWFGPVVPHAPTRNPAVRTVQRYMAWEHLLLGNLDPAAMREAIREPGGQSGCGPLEAQCRLADELGRSPAEVDTERLRTQFSGVRTLRLAGSGLVITTGELNVLADYLSHPADIFGAPADFIVPIVQAVRSQSYRQISRIMERRPAQSRRTWSKLRYPDARVLPEIRGVLELNALGRKCQLAVWDRYPSVLARNAAHFAPFSWYRWQSFHLLARELIAEAQTKPDGERDRLRAYAQVCAGYADHFLHDSFAAGHLVNKTLVMQWYIEWLLKSRLPFADRALLAGMTYQRQPLLHCPDLYRPEPDETGQRLYPAGNPDPNAPTDPESVMEAQTLQARSRRSGVSGQTEAEVAEAYRGYLALLSSSVAQLSTRVVHDHLCERSLIIASRPDGPRYRIRGDGTMHTDEAGAVQAVTAACASRQAIADLLSRGETEISSRQIFASMPSLVEVDGVLLPLREWHDKQLRDLCMEELFGRTRVPGLLLGMTARHLGMPSGGCAD